MWDGFPKPSDRSRKGSDGLGKPSHFSSLRRCQAIPDASSSDATAANRSGCRGTSTSRNRGCAGASARNVASASDSSGSCVLPARNTTSSAQSRLAPEIAMSVDCGDRFDRRRI